VAYAKAVLLGQLAPHDRALAVGEEGLALLRRKEKLGVHVEIARRVDGELGEEVALRHVDAAEPVRPGDGAHARELPDLLRIGEREREDERNRASGHEPRAGRGIRPRVPCLHDRAQQPESGDGDDDADDRQRGAQLVPQRVFQDEHRNEHWEAGPAAMPTPTSGSAQQ
jgi:hypothetical protein